ncbi:MAG: aspartate aminotransferase family protein [Spirochaetes bacterium]|nr:aspartate aminotransferase family protein [Spirochaetota bacterium]
MGKKINASAINGTAGVPDQNKIPDLYAAHVSPGKVDLYRKYGLVLVPGKRGGCILRSIDGKSYYNCHCNGGVFNLGHRNARVIGALTSALRTYDIGNHHLISGPRARLAAMLADTMPRGLTQTVFGVGGGEAVDLGIKLARGVTGRHEIISARGGYHGHTGFALATGDKKYRERFGPMAPGFRQVPFNSTEALKRAVSAKTAAVIFETVPATAGILVPDRGFFTEAQRICRAAGALLIIDEIQTGFGRTGKLWGFEHFNVTPDIVTLGKGMSGGIYPISATVFHERFAPFFKKDPFIHISTFGGSEVGCQTAIEVLSISREQKFLDHVLRMGGLFKRGLQEMGEQSPGLGLQVRGLGLMMGMKFKDETTALFLVKVLFDNGIYVVYSGNDPSVIQFLPPLIITEQEGDRVLRRIEKSFRQMAGTK